MYKCTEDRFLNDVSNHTMTIIHDDGDVHRHIRFSQESTNSYYYDLITWDGHLCISGDMGTFVFNRLHDMFEFFMPTDRSMQAKPETTLKINAYYWQEKLVSEGINSKAEEWDGSKFRDSVKEYFDAYIDDNEEFITADAKCELWSDIEYHVLSYSSHEYESINAIHTFESEWADMTFRFDDFFGYDSSYQTYTFHYIWCLYAIVYGIAEYNDNRDKK